MSSFSFSRDNIAVNPTVTAITGGTTTASGTLFFKIFNQNLAGNNFGSNSVSVSWAVGQQVRVQIPATMRATGEFVERFVVAGSTTGAAGTWVQLAVIEAVDTNGASLALPLTIDLSSDYDLSLVKASATVVALPTTAKFGALTTIAALGGNVYRFEAATWPVPADGTGVISVAGGRWVKHYSTFNPEPVSMTGAQGQRQANNAVATPTKLIGYTGGSFSRSFYYSIYNESVTQDLVAGTNVGLTVLADGQPVTAQLTEKIEITLVGYVNASGVLDTAPAVGLPSLLYDYSNIGQVYLPVNLPSGSQAVYRLRFNYSAIDLGQNVRSIVVNLSTYATAPTKAPWAGLAGDSFIADSGGRFRFFPGLGLSGQVDDGQITVNRFESPVTPEQTVIGFAPALAGQLAVANATGQVLRQAPGYSLGTNEVLLATVGTVAGEHIRTSMGSVTLAAAGGVNVTVTNPVTAGGRGTVRSNYGDLRIAGLSGYCRWNPLSVVIYLTNGGTTYRSVVTPLNQTSQVFTLDAPGTIVAAPTAANFGLFDPVGANATVTTGTIPAGTYQISIGYLYDGNQITAIAHNTAFTIYNGNAAGVLGAHEATYNHGSFISLTQAQALVTAHEATFNHANFATNAGVAATYLTQASAATLYKPLTTDDSVATGLRFALKTAITGTPANGEIQFNNATLTGVTQLLISETGRDGSAIPTLLDMLQQTTRIIIQAEQSEGLYAWFNIAGAPTDSGAYRTVPVAFITAPTGVTTVAGLGASGAELTLDFYGVGGSASTAVASGIRFTYNTTTTLPAGSKQFRTNNALPDTATALSFSSVEDQSNNPTLTAILGRLKTGAIIEVRQSATCYYRYTCTADAILDTSVTPNAYTVSVSSLPSGSDAITAGTVFLSILSDAPSVSSGGGGGGGTTWTTENADLTFSSANGDVGVVADATVTLTITMPPGIADSRKRSVRGKGVGRWQVKGATFINSQGAQDTGVRRLTTHQYAGVDLFHLGNNIWLVESPADFTGIEFYTGTVDTRLSDYQAALATEGYTLTAGEVTALSNWLTAIDAITTWANVVAFYPLIGNTLARGRINFVAPNNTAHYILDASNQAVFNAFGANVQGTGGFNVQIPKAFLSAALLNTRFTTIQASVRALAAPNNSYAFPFRYEAATGHYSLGINGNGVSVAGIDQATAAGNFGHQYGNWAVGTAAHTSNYVVRSAANGASNINGTVFRDGASVGTNTVANIARGSISPSAGEFYIMSGGSVLGNKMTTGSLRSILILSSAVSFTDAQCLALSNADTALQNALGRA